jgi:hypothetical protein
MSVYIEPKVSSIHCACVIFICGLPIIFPHYLINVMIFWVKSFIEHKMCALTFSTFLSETFLIPRKIEWDMMRNVYWPSCKCYSCLF